MPDYTGRDEYERRIARQMGRAQQEELARLIEELGDPPDLNNLPGDFWTAQAAAYSAVLYPLFVELFIGRAEQSIAEMGIGVDVAVLNNRAATWARQYSFDLIRDITERTRSNLQANIASFAEGKLDLGSLQDLIARDFGPSRAANIAITETTRALAEGEHQYQSELEGLGLTTEGVWNTNQDDRVCAICGPNDGRPTSAVGRPPGHPGCRCWETTRVVERVV